LPFRMGIQLSIEYHFSEFSLQLSFKLLTSPNERLWEIRYTALNIEPLNIKLHSKYHSDIFLLLRPISKDNKLLLEYSSTTWRANSSRILCATRHLLVKSIYLSISLLPSLGNLSTFRPSFLISAHFRIPFSCSTFSGVSCGLIGG
jgi:hypothetical protein